MTKEVLTTTEAARLAEVAPSTMKRWVDDGLLASQRTPGGHRRLERREVLRFIRLQKEPRGEAPGSLGSWRDPLVRGDRYAIDALLLHARGRLGAWYRVADELTHVLREMGEAWREGTLSIAEEHVASEALARALTRMGDALPTSGIAKKALLACAPDDDHTLGLCLAELCLKEMGFDCTWLGRNTPLAELETAVSDESLSVVVVTASSTAGNERCLRRVAERLAKGCEQNDVRLIMGGGGPWPETVPGGHRVKTFPDFHDLLKREFES